MDVLSMVPSMVPHGGPGPWWPVFPAFWIVFWIVVATLAFRARRAGRGPWAARRTPPAAPPQSPTAAAEQIVAERYARGEMSGDEYLERVSVLRSGA
ncbi:SHOCT domain-containing protein [Streptosporangium sp. NPDC050855]|uniref:SHOCT domain-containing protein n=1 Tax=Streptosporangium sp. NPDC050855 TaxID=3366194 RepID=UPI0037A78C67